MSFGLMQFNRAGATTQLFFARGFTGVSWSDKLSVFDVRWWSVAPFWLPTNREPGEIPGRPRRCDRALFAKHSVKAIVRLGDREGPLGETLDSQKTYHRLAYGSAARAAAVSEFFISKDRIAVGRALRAFPLANCHATGPSFVRGCATCCDTH